MEQTPIPQNILEVEFKLFGSFTLRQFAKIIIGSFIALLIFVSPLPVVIKFPLMAGSVILGILSAVINNFSIWINGFLKALFISPRYVWVKEQSTPDVLKVQSSTTAKKEPTQNQKLDIEDIPFDKIFTSNVAGETNDDIIQELNPQDASNFTRIYDEFYQGTPKTKIAPVAAQSKVQVMPAADKKTLETYKKEIEKLKYELSMLNKDENYKQREAQIIAEINDIYREVKLLAGDEKLQSQQAFIKDSKNRNIKEDGQILFGVLVDKKDMPVANGVINVKSLENNQVYSAISNGQGRFTTGKKLPYGEYDISITHNTNKFHTYRIKIASGITPAYKFRTK